MEKWKTSKEIEYVFESFGHIVYLRPNKNSCFHREKKKKYIKEEENNTYFGLSINHWTAPSHMLFYLLTIMI